MCDLYHVSSLALCLKLELSKGSLLFFRGPIEKESSQLLMAFLYISKPALLCLLLWLSLSKEASLDNRAAKDKCKNPIVSPYLQEILFQFFFLRVWWEIATMRAATSSLVLRYPKKSKSGLKVQQCKSRIVI